MPPRQTESACGCSNCARLQEETHELQEETHGLQEKAHGLQEKIHGLEAEVSELTEGLRRANRQGAPFSKGGKRKPGRKAGKGTFVRRREPAPKPSDKVEEIAAPLDDRQCPQCGQEMEASTEMATATDVPAEPVRVIKCIEVAVGRCRRCGITVRGRHEDLAED